MKTERNFTDQKPFIATKDDVKLNWNCGKNGKYFRCGLCGYKFKAGDTVRWQYTNDTPGAGGNPLVCTACDGPRDWVVIKWKQMHYDWKELRENKFWWFCKGDD